MALSQEFARPIEDEDIFGVNDNSVPDEQPVQEPYEQSPAQLKKQRMKEMFLQQAKVMALTPNRRLGEDFGPKGTIDVQIAEGELVSNSQSKLLFHKLFKNSNKNPDLISPEKKKNSWEHHKAELRLSICAQKRKVWDSFQQPVDGYDEEEEIVESKMSLVEDEAQDVDLGSEHEPEDENMKSDTEDDEEVEHRKDPSSEESAGEDGGVNSDGSDIEDEFADQFDEEEEKEELCDEDDKAQEEGEDDEADEEEEAGEPESEEDEPESEVGGSESEMNLLASEEEDDPMKVDLDKRVHRPKRIIESDDDD